jgi:hypothetical protein
MVPICSVQNVPNQGGATDLVMLNSVHAFNRNDARNFFAAESPTQQYTTPVGAQTFGGLDASLPTAVLDSAGNVFWTFNATSTINSSGLDRFVRPPTATH